MSNSSSLTCAKIMGEWVIDMADLDAADAVLCACRAALEASLDVRHTLWGVQVRTGSDSAADYLAGHYGEAPSAAVALAA